MKEKEAYASYIWINAEIGKIKREIRENERLLKILEETKKLYEKQFNKKEIDKIKRRYD